MELRNQMEELAKDLRKNAQQDDSKERRAKLDKLTADLVLIQERLRAAELYRANVSIVSVIRGLA
jgi:hypothetical protein